MEQRKKMKLYEKRGSGREKGTNEARNVRKRIGEVIQRKKGGGKKIKEEEVFM